MTNPNPLVILDIPITFFDRSDLPYCQWIELVGQELSQVQKQLDRLTLPDFLIATLPQQTREEIQRAKAWYCGALTQWADWITMYNALDIKGKSDLNIDQIVRLYGEKHIPGYHPNAEMQAALHLAVRVNGLTVEEAIEAVMLSYRLCDCWEAQRARAWKEVLS